ncbi:MAG: beta-lactamase family protein [Candidatus Omnitrophica bacterium]|nr:beta-lactamase family protein [Candidatus Omnitrophota bacterium]MBU1630399.1 beta-lactamase family protein [Candidatus Omnitrophota bacterium]
MFCLVIFFITVSCFSGEILIRDPTLLRKKLEEIRIKRKLPAVAAAIVIGDRVVVASAVGLRKWGEDIPVTRNDAFELGSITKPITGTLTAILKDQNKLDWDTTIGQIFPEMFPGHQSLYHYVTVRQLLSHTSGLPYQPTMKEADIDAGGTTVMEQRVAYVSAALSDKQEAIPGSAYIYSGGGIIVASMEERLTGKLWESFVNELIFQKLKMNTAGFGPMATPPDLIDAPWYHQLRNGKITPLSPTGDSVYCRSPVGGIHCSVIDLGRFAAFHLLGTQAKQSEGLPITQKTLREFYTVVEIGKGKRKLYTTGGWRVQPTNWAKGPVYWHSGQSQSRGYAIVHIVPEQNYATCVMMNIGGDEASKAGGEINMLLVEALRNANYNPSLLFSEKEKDGKGGG